MTIRRTILRMTPVVVLLAVTTAWARSPDPQRRPNILWISCEDISPDLGCYGSDYAITPNLDRLAAEGVRYTNAFTVAGVCAPSRSGIITGMYPTSIGTHHMRCRGVPPEYVKCFTEYLRAAGYYCVNNVKTDYNFPTPRTAWDESSRRAHWRNCPPNMPFFCVINFTITHESQIRLPDRQFWQRTAALQPSERHDPLRAVLPPYYPDTPRVRQDWARYHDLITALDKEVGRVLRELEEDGLADETVVFFWSDHGRGLPRAKRWIYDSGIRVPLIVRWPGKIKPGTVDDRLISLIDLGPTVLSIAGVPIPEHMQGKPFLGPAAAAPRQYVFAARDRMDESYDIIRAVRDRRFKYIRNYEPYRPYAQRIAYMELMPTMQEMRRLWAAGKLSGARALYFRPTKPLEELYDTWTDPHEVHNLADDPAYRDVLQRLRRVHENWVRETGDLGLIPEGQLWERLKPRGQAPRTATPTADPPGGNFEGRVHVRLACPTPGASIAYTTERGPAHRVHWKLYTGPIVLTDDAVLRVRAIRYGYDESEEARFDFRVRAPGR